MLMADQYRRPPLVRDYTFTATAVGLVWEHPSLVPGRYAVSVRPDTSAPQPYIVEVRSYYAGAPRSTYIIPALGDVSIADPGIHRAVIDADRIEVYLHAAGELSASIPTPAGETWHVSIAGPLAESGAMDGIQEQGPALWYESALLDDGSVHPVTSRVTRKVPIPPWATGIAVAIQQTWATAASYGSIDIWGWERHDDGTGTPVRIGYAMLPSSISGRWEYAGVVDPASGTTPVPIPPGAFGRIGYSLDSGILSGSGNTASMLVFPVLRR